MSGSHANRDLPSSSDIGANMLIPSLAQNLLPINFKEMKLSQLIYKDIFSKLFIY